MTVNYKIYGLQEVGTNDIKYIGLTKNKLTRRLSSHICDKIKTIKSMWLKSINNNVEIILIEENLTREQASEKEKLYIRLYKSFGAKLKNMTEGGEAPMYIPGRQLSEKSRNKISIALSGLNNSQSRPILQIDPKTEEVLYAFPTRSIAAQILGIPDSSIQRVMCCKMPTAGGFKWTYITKEQYRNFDFKDKAYKLVNHNKIKVICPDYSIDYFESTNQAVTFTGVNPTSIRFCLNGKLESCKGYYFSKI